MAWCNSIGEQPSQGASRTRDRWGVAAAWARAMSASRSNDLGGLAQRASVDGRGKKSRFGFFCCNRV
jgi:hypothetical protein